MARLMEKSKKLAGNVIRRNLSYRTRHRTNNFLIREVSRMQLTYSLAGLVLG